ncbi:MAG: NADH-quinone oxidoreductase subunit C [Candidatus Riflebacteria bacterium]|nr:NADH-quinone oxidoreductase subunit C [Candidatus Riflebacteria bacterium]
MTAANINTNVIKNTNLKMIIETLGTQIGKESFLDSSDNPKDPKTCTIKIQPDRIVQCAEFLKSQNFSYLSFITAVDFKKEIELVYWFTSIIAGLNIQVKCSLPRDNPRIPSLVEKFATADWNEREVYDLFGVNFLNHPNLKRILTWDEFEGHPLLKKYKVIDEPDEFPILT